MFVSDGGLLGLHSTVAIETKLWRNLWGKGFSRSPVFEETFVTPQCDFRGGLPPETADVWLSRTAVVAGDTTCNV